MRRYGRGYTRGYSEKSLSEVYNLGVPEWKKGCSGNAAHLCYAHGLIWETVITKAIFVKTQGLWENVAYPAEVETTPLPCHNHGKLACLSSILNYWLKTYYSKEKDWKI